MKYFIDTEFIESPNTIELISIGLVAEDGREYYAVHTECDCKNADAWVKENVLMKMPEYNKGYNDLRCGGGSPEKYGRKTIADIKRELIHFCGQDNSSIEKCEFYGYYADYDWVVFCWIFGKMINLPKGFPMYCKDLKQMMDEKGLDKEWKQMNCPDPEGEHNALVDAKWNKKLFDLLNAQNNTPVKEDWKEAFASDTDNEAKHRASQHNYTTWQHDAKWFKRGAEWAKNWIETNNK